MFTFCSLTINICSNTEIDSYISKDGITIRDGDTLIIGKALIDREKYLYDDVFSYIVIGNTKGTRTKEFRSLPHNYSGSKVVVKSLFVVHKKYTGYKLFPNRKKMHIFQDFHKIPCYLHSNCLECKN